MNRQKWILGLLAVLVVLAGVILVVLLRGPKVRPDFSSVADATMEPSLEAKQSVLSSMTKSLRTTVALYRLQHEDQWPTVDGKATSKWSWDKLCKPSRGADGTVFGPCLSGVPVNPLTKSSIVADTATKGVGWIVRPGTEKLLAVDEAGKEFKETADEM